MFNVENLTDEQREKLSKIYEDYSKMSEESKMFELLLVTFFLSALSSGTDIEVKDDKYTS